MHLHLLPFRTAAAAENMALDFLLLQRYPHGGEARLRHYDWARPAFTFGYSQKVEFVRSQLPQEDQVEICRRPTGGGIVDHRQDWTYALVIPRGHPLEKLRATESYRLIHESITAALRAQHQPVETKRTCEPAREGEACAPAGICFTRAEQFDVVNTVSGAKVAGAAQKRNKHGLLFQGSLSKAAVSSNLDWDAFYEAFASELSKVLEITSEETFWPEFNEDEVSGLIETYSTPEWNEFR